MSVSQSTAYIYGLLSYLKASDMVRVLDADEKGDAL